ncbi:HTH DNA binding protein [Mycobacterium phage SirDuracell]|uniref:Helix-turn-helix DNA binding domain protein n=2 Tax=Kostyavirus TaxID=1623284 RepID=G1D5Z4_9CAUD|nr:HTH DNA binding protein [Mycobacterium phage Lilac]YP_009591290.1 HTH DNA binding protein [Mycobacterium phage Bask21]YP_009608059.1 HTH DNA binding protein [Mycobacterium phage SirDuracell]ATN92547.1 helix-turn-helix DNA binding domain protein [Mycobacterium phage Willez]ATS92731.1 helix-turn-helix DNA binding domain protein [Mycobacterium phage MISSy]AVP42909.1 helix-turn-helix DNA binding domain protein [Mycobacterium phage MPhalcon]AYQ99804.1 DNA binding protein [Mycobacterium phage Ma
MSVDPIARPDFNPMTYRPANEETVARIRAVSDAYWQAREALEALRAELHEEVRAAKAAGHSYPQLRDATGLSIAALQRVIATAETQT